MSPLTGKIVTEPAPGSLSNVMVPTGELEGYGKRSRPVRLIAGALVVIVLGGAAFLALKPAPEKSPPDFRLPLLSGGELSSAQLKGSPVVLNFFASWCEPCREEAPLLEATARAYHDDGVRVVGVNINDTQRNARRFVHEFGITYPVVRDPNRTLARGLGVYGLPETFFIDADWTLLRASKGPKTGDVPGSMVQLGAISAAQLRTGVETMLEHRRA